MYRGTAEPLVVVLRVQASGHQQAEELRVVVLQDWGEPPGPWAEVEGAGGVGGRDLGEPESGVDILPKYF